MIARGSGAIVNLTSLAAHNGGGPGASVYSAAKAAVLALTKAYAKELAPHGIRVNAVSPGLIGGTPFHKTFTAPEAFAATIKTIPLGRAGTPDDVASVIAFLAARTLRTSRARLSKSTAACSCVSEGTAILIVGRGWPRRFPCARREDRRGHPSTHGNASDRTRGRLARNASRGCRVWAP